MDSILGSSRLDESDLVMRHRARFCDNLFRARTRMLSLNETSTLMGINDSRGVRASLFASTSPPIGRQTNGSAFDDRGLRTPLSGAFRSVRCFDALVCARDPKESVREIRGKYRYVDPSMLTQRHERSRDAPVLRKSDVILSTRSSSQLHTPASRLVGGQPTSASRQTTCR